MRVRSLLMVHQKQLKLFDKVVLKRIIFSCLLHCTFLLIFLDQLVKKHFDLQKILHIHQEVSNKFSIWFQIYHSNQIFLFQIQLKNQLLQHHIFCKIIMTVFMDEYHNHYKYQKWQYIIYHLRLIVF